MNTPLLEIGLKVPPVETLQEFTPDKRHLDDHCVVGFNNRDGRTRAFNLLRTQLTKRLAQRKAKMIGITSATPSAGKSFVAVNLAAALSRVADDELYLIDLDLRRGSIGTALGLETERSLSDYLSGKADGLAGLGWRIKGTCLAVYPTAATVKDSAELLANGRLDALLQGLRFGFGDKALALIDMPPVFANDDAMVISQQLDGYLLVIESGANTQKQVEEVMEMLSPTPCLGTVLNRYGGSILDRYGYGSANAYESYY